MVWKTRRTRKRTPQAEKAYNKVLQLLSRRVSHVILQLMEEASWAPELILELLSRMADSMLMGVEHTATKMAAQFTQQQKKDSDRAFVDVMPGFSMRDLVDDEGIRKEMSDAVRKNVNLITSIPQTRVADMAAFIEGSIVDGTFNDQSPIEQIKPMLKKGLFDNDAKASRRARLIARDQSAKLNSNLTTARFSQHGIRYYRWRAQGGRSGDGRTRTEHKARHGFVFSLVPAGGPSVVKVNGKRIKVRGAFENISGNATKADMGHPGEGIQCRCIMDPVIENV